MAAGNLQRALDIAQAYTWNQSHGYVLGGMGYPDFDCSGFICRCLYEAGFNVDFSSHYGTMDLDDNPMSSYNILGNAGFNLIHVTDLNNMPQLKSGDIVVMNSYDQSWSGAGGHAFFYAENIPAYIDYAADSDVVATVPRAKIEASSSRGNTNPGDSRKNGTGAYWEVWTHAYAILVDSSTYDPQSTTHHNYVTIARWPSGLGDYLGALLLFKLGMNR